MTRVSQAKLVLPDCLYMSIGSVQRINTSLIIRRRHHLLHISLATSTTVLPNSPYPKTQSEPERKRNKRTFPTHTRGYSQGLNRTLEESPVAGSEVRVQGRARHPSAV